MFMSATDEELRHVSTDLSIDHVSYALFVFSLSFVLFLHIAFCVRLYSISGRNADGTSKEEQLAKEVNATEAGYRAIRLGDEGAPAESFELGDIDDDDDDAEEIGPQSKGGVQQRQHQHSNGNGNGHA